MYGEDEEKSEFEELNINEDIFQKDSKEKCQLMETYSDNNHFTQNSELALKNES